VYIVSYYKYIIYYTIYSHDILSVSWKNTISVSSALIDMTPPTHPAKIQKIFYISKSFYWQCVVPERFTFSLHYGGFHCE